MAARKKAAPPKRGASRYPANAKKPIPGWVWLASGLVIGGFVVFLTRLEPGGEQIKRSVAEPQAAKPAQPAKPKYDFYTLLPESEVILPPEAAKAAPSAPVTPEQAAKIDAARAQAALNGQTPPPPPTVAGAPTASPRTAAPEPSGTPKAPLTLQYFLQAGSFRKQTDAERVRAQIILLGQNVRVESGTVREETWYRVLVGPFANKDQLAGAQKQLASGGFSNLLQQQRQVR